MNSEDGVIPGTFNVSGVGAHLLRDVADVQGPADPRPVPAPSEQAKLAQLLERIALRDPDALSKLYDATAPRVYAVAKRFVRNSEAAEEVVSDVYFQVWRDAARYDAGRASVHGWLLLLCRSRALDALRRTDNALVHPDPYLLTSAPVDHSRYGEDLIEASARGSQVRAALALLPPLQRQLIALAFFRDFTHSEIAKHCGLPLGTVKTHIRQALRRLRDHGGVAACG